jgi:ATP-binding cassette subfamily B protein
MKDAANGGAPPAPPSTPASPDAPPPLRARVQALRALPAFLGMAWRTRPAYAATVVLLRLVRAGVPVGVLWVGKLIIDQVVAAARGGGDPGTLWKLLALEATLVLAGDVLARASQLVESLLGDLFSIAVSVRIMEHASTLDLEQFEDPAFYDHLERARQQTNGDHIGVLSGVMDIAQSLVTIVVLAGAVVAYSPWLGLLLAVSVLPAFLGETHFAALEYSLLFRYTPERRQLNYLRAMAAGDRTAKEVQMFGMADWLIARYRALAERFYRDNRRLAARRSVVSSLLAAAGTAGYYAAYAFLVLAAARGAISVGQLTFLAGSFSRGRDLCQQLMRAAAQACEQSLYLRDLFFFFGMRPRIAAAAGARPVPARLGEGFVFENVGFRYPGSERWAVRGVNLRIDPRECVALVGENGAGKTTLTKLLGRLYDPTEGRITLDGMDLREYDPASLRRSIGVVFQDFVRYDMRLDENIGMGDVQGVRGYLDAALADPAPPLPEAIGMAAERSLAATLLPRLPGGYRQMLGRVFEGGVSLSGGEWQKIALARAYMRLEGSQTLILDEPTAALDARAEFEIFERFRELTRGRMAVLISHRFSTVRMADRVVVLQGGRVVEDGSHDALVGQDGLYAELFGMQAAGYQ